ncbi:MAG: TRAP transporter small permease [Rhizobiaceae bacterium]
MRYERIVEKVTLTLGTAVLVAMAVLIAADVLLRQTMDAGIPTVPDFVSFYLMVAISFIPIAYTQVYRSHVETTVLFQVLPPALKKILLWLNAAIGIGMFSLLTYLSLVEALNQTEKRSFIESGKVLFQIWPSYWLLPISFGAMLFVLCHQIWMARVETEISLPYASGDSETSQ